MYIALINYGMGNIKSVENSFIKAGAEVRVTSDPMVINRSAAIVLPGVGGFIDAYINLERKGLLKTIYKNINKKPFLGICLGMQLLFEYSLEVRKQRGLGIFKGSVHKISGKVKIPHMGWNQINIIKKNSKILKGIKNSENFYFVHSYHVIPSDYDIVSSTTDYGTDIVASIEKDDIYGFQFHPEKSSLIGQRLIRNFLELTGGI
jgi:imidazole glycerol-phosphate synthase subunit HisH